jgi:CBS domain-containing protein
MSFLVAFNGQFSPLIHPAPPRPLVSAVKPLPPAEETHEFQRVLEQEVDHTLPKARRRELAAYAEGARSFELQRQRSYARDIMSSPVHSIPETSSASEALELLRAKGFRHLPVVNELGVITGMISDRELQGELRHKSCQQVMQPKVIVAEEQTSINELAIILLREKLNALPIVDHRREVTGIVTLSDILEYVIGTTGLSQKA